MRAHESHTRVSKRETFRLALATAVQLSFSVVGADTIRVKQDTDTDTHHERRRRITYKRQPKSIDPESRRKKGRVCARVCRKLSGDARLKPSGRVLFLRNSPLTLFWEPEWWRRGWKGLEPCVCERPVLSVPPYREWISVSRPCETRLHVSVSLTDDSSRVTHAPASGPGAVGE